MATTKRIPHPPKTQGMVRKLIAYVTNPSKTTDEQCLYVEAFGCSLPTSANDFMAMRNRWGKNSGNFAYHFEQSFAPGETTPELAHQCGIELAQALFGAEYQVVMGTHLDKEHLHNHFAVNAVSGLDGHKLQTDHDFLRRMREESDRICRKHDLSVVEHPRGRGKSYAEWVTEKNGGFTWRGQIRADIDAALSHASTLRELLAVLEQQGYTVKTGKHLGVSPPGTETNFRLYKLGAGYSEEELADRLLHVAKVPLAAQKIKPMPPRRVYRYRGTFRVLLQRRRGGLGSYYYHYLYQLRKLLASLPNVRARASHMARRDAKQIEKFAADLRLLSSHKIDTISQLADCAAKLQAEQAALETQRSDLRAALQKAETPEQLAAIRGEIEGVSDMIKNRGYELASCERIYQRSLSRASEPHETVTQQKGRMNDGSRSGSDRHPAEIDDGRR